MNKNILIVLALNWALLGCSGAPTAPDSSPLAGCRTQFPWFCRGDPQAPEINVHANKNGKLKVSPYCVKAAGGTQLVFKLTPSGSNPLNSAKVIPKNDTHTWLKGENDSDPDQITIDVPPDLDKEVKYYYGVKTNRGCVDPRVKVDN
jgi:hypothetical protein